MTYDVTKYGYLGLLCAWNNVVTSKDPAYNVVQYYVHHTQLHACGFEADWLLGRNTPTSAVMRASILMYNGKDYYKP